MLTHQLKEVKTALQNALGRSRIHQLLGVIALSALLLSLACARLGILRRWLAAWRLGDRVRRLPAIIYELH